MTIEEVSSYFIIIECVFVVITLLLALYTYVVGAVDQAAREDIGRSCCEKRQMGYFVTSPPQWWSYYRRRGVTRIPKVPTLDNLIQAGDRLLFTSALFDHIDPSPQEVGWVSLYTQFFREMSWLDLGRTGKARKDNDISKYLNESDKRRTELLKSAWTPVKSSDTRNAIKERPGDEERGHGPGAITRKILWKPNSDTPVRHCLFPPRSKGPPMLVCCVLPLETSDSKPGSTLANLTLPDLRSLWIINGKPCVEVTREELAGLALALGVPLFREADGSISGSGPFGTHIRVVRDINHWQEWRFRLSHQQRQLCNEPLNGSGYSTLFAKYIACDCLPLFMLKDEDDESNLYSDLEHGGIKCVRCLHVDAQFLAWIRGTRSHMFGHAVKRLREAIEKKQSKLSRQLETERENVKKLANVPKRLQELSAATESLRVTEKAQRQLWVPEQGLTPLGEVMHSCQKLKYLDRLPGAYRIDAYRYYPGLDPASRDYYYQSSPTTGSNTAETCVVDEMPLEVGVNKEKNKDEVEVDVQEENDEDPIEKVLNDEDSEKERFGYTLHWFRAVARIAFGGLVPQAGKSVADAVCFTVIGACRDDHHGGDKGGRKGDRDRSSEVEEEYQSSATSLRNQSSVSASPDDSSRPPHHSSSRHRGRSSTRKYSRDTSCAEFEKVYDESKSQSRAVIRALQKLLEELQKECYNSYRFKLFGEYADGVDRRQSIRTRDEWIRATTVHTTRHAGDLFGRYMTALERLVAISWCQHLDTLWESAGSGNSGLFGSAHRPWLPDYRSFTQNSVLSATEFSEQSAQSYVQRVFEKCVELLVKSFVLDPSSNRRELLVSEVSVVRNKLRSKVKARISAEDCANVARCIIAAWAVRVPLIELELEASEKKSSNAAFHDLPPVMAFG